MEGTQVKTRKIRSRLKSATNETPLDDSNGLNGENKPDNEPLTVFNPESTDASDDSAAPKPDEEGSDAKSITSEDSKSEKSTRKRKLSELKSNDGSSDEATTATPVKDTKGDESSVSTESNEPNPTDKSDDVSFDTSDLTDVTTKQLLGKGKRARVPNKRYSDFPLKAVRASLDAMDAEALKQKLENGEQNEPIAQDSGSISDSAPKDTLSESPALSSFSSPIPAAVTTVKSSRSSQNSSPSTPALKRQKLTVDLGNPNFLKPFHHGWKRELVYRATGDNNNKRNGDIYYYTPAGKKVRSMREVAENLKSRELTLEDFTFFKEPIGLDDPDKEIIRDAKLKTGAGSSTTTPSSKKSTPKAKTSKVTPTPSPKVTVTDEPKTKNSSRSGFRIKLPARPSPAKFKEKKPKDHSSASAAASHQANATTSSNKKTSKAGTNTNKPCRPCSIRCQGVSGIIPRLQCRICLCLYHAECVGLSPLASILGYVCKNCQLDQGTSSGCAATIAPPPLTPINALKPVKVQSNILPKLQRIPRPNDTTEQSDQPEQPLPCELPQLTPRPTPSKTPESNSENKSIVGSVTTWFPSSSKIQVTQGGNTCVSESSSIVPPPRPQYVEFLGNKQYLIIPKHNIVSVSPTIALSAPSILTNPLTDSTAISENAPLGGFNLLANQLPNSSETLDSASLGPSLDSEAVPKIKNEPSSPSKQLVSSNEGVGSSKGVEGTPNDALSESTLPGDLLEDNANADQVSSPKKSKRLATLTTATPVITLETDKRGDPPQFMDNYLQNVVFGYSTLLHVFQYLKVQDLLKAGCVCTMWNDMSNHCALWKTVRMKNSQIHSFKGMANALQKHNTVHLDLRKMLLPSNNSDDIWEEFSTEIKKVESLRKIELCRCPSVVVERLAGTNPKLEVINAVTIKCSSISLTQMAMLNNLQELRLKAGSGLSLTSDFSALSQLKQLKHLSLTSILELNKLNIEVIADLKNLESLDLGDCPDFPKTFGSQILIKLEKLEKLRLEKGQGNCYTFEILEAVKNMPHLEQLELVNFDIKNGFDKALGACTNIKKLLIIPTYISQSATTNHMVLGGVLRLQSTLSHFVWGVTLELLRVTELFVDQCDDSDKKEKEKKKPTGNGDSIPVLKPVPLLAEGRNEIPPAQDPPQVEILPLPNLQKLLLQSLPTTRVKILKIPFHATWRQSITDTVN